MDSNTRAAYDKAQRRAKDMGGADKVTPLGDNRYSVLSSGGDQFYTVTVVERPVQHIYLCTCVAGQKGSGLCWHRGAVMLARVREATVAACRPAPEARRVVGTAARAVIWGEEAYR